jgi:hypothetical protein
VYTAIDKVNINLEYKDAYVRKQHEALEQKHEMFSVRFDEFFKTLN